MLQRVCSVVDHSGRRSVVRTKKWWSEPCGLNVTISASYDWSVAIFTTSLESQESYLTLRTLTLQITRDFFRLHNTFARLYNAAASPASRLRSAGSLAIKLSRSSFYVWEYSSSMLTYKRHLYYYLRNYYLRKLLPEKHLPFDWLRADVFQLNLKYLHVKL